MDQGQCRVCHVTGDLSHHGYVKSHTNKYTKRGCKGSYKAPVERVEPKDYAEAKLIPVPGDGFSGIVTVYLGGVLTGVMFGWWIF